MTEQKTAVSKPHEIRESDMRAIAEWRAGVVTDKRCRHCGGERGYTGYVIEEVEGSTLRNVRLTVCCAKPAQTEYVLMRESLAELHQKADAIGRLCMAVKNDQDAYADYLGRRTFWGGVEFAFGQTYRGIRFAISRVRGWFKKSNPQTV